MKDDKVPYNTEEISKVGNFNMQEATPCAAYIGGKLFKIFESRADCARYFRKKYSTHIGQCIARKGKIIFEGKRYAIRNYNPDKKKI